MQSYSDSQTIDQIHSPITIQYLVNQNKMKEIALNKATNLIDLLKIQLQVQKNSHEESIKIMQEDLRYKYQMEIMRLYSKIQSLQNQLKSKDKMNETSLKKSYTYYQSNNSKFKYKDINRQSPMMRTNISQQLSKQKRRKFSNKKIVSKNSMSQISNNAISQNQNDSFSQKLQKFDKNLLISWILSSQIRYQQVFQSLAEQYQSNFAEIIQQRQKMKTSIFEINDLLQKQKKRSFQQEKKQVQYKNVIQNQNELIILLTKQIQQIQQSFLKASCTLSNLTNSSKNSYQDEQIISCRQVLQQLSVNQNYLRAILVENKNRIKEKVQLMENENIQLRDIMDNMIKLVKNNKKLQIH